MRISEKEIERISKIHNDLMNFQLSENKDERIQDLFFVADHITKTMNVLSARFSSRDSIVIKLMHEFGPIDSCIRAHEEFYHFSKPLTKEEITVEDLINALLVYKAVCPEDTAIMTIAKEIESFGNK